MRAASRLSRSSAVVPSERSSRVSAHKRHTFGQITLLNTLVRFLVTVEKKKTGEMFAAKIVSHPYLSKSESQSNDSLRWPFSVGREWNARAIGQNEISAQ